MTIIDAGIRKEMELQVVSPVADFRDLPADTVWPDIYQKLLELIKGHRSTLIFTNNRAAAERITAELNDRAGFELARAHHGSVSKEKRKEIEQKLKQGELPVLVATATLELGIDMGAIDLVCQVESPKSVARGLQRVGRAGHLYKAASKGRLLPKMRSDLLEMAVITRLMHQGEVAPIHIPRNCLDILAQQIVAIVSLKPWKLNDVYHLVQQAYPYRELPRDYFLGVLGMLSGRYPSNAFRDLKPRISWDRVNNLLYPLPGTQRLAIMSGGAIPDTGQYPCYLEDGHTKIGELEEEFIYERRLGEVFVLGTNSWRIKEITHDRVIVSPAPGEPARTPFWKGEFMSRSVNLGQKYGEFCRELKTKIDSPVCVTWLQKECDLDADAAQNLRDYFLDQRERTGDIPDDLTILIESFTDEMGDLRVLIHSPYGGRLHLPWRLAILSLFRKQWNIEPESWHSDVGILFRFPADKFQDIMMIIQSINSDNVEQLVINELGNSFFFGLRFRHNANRAMLIPRPRPGKRAPLWLQRIRSRDLLEISRQYPSFPIMMETYRESIQDFFAVDELKEMLRQIESGQIIIKTHRGHSPSPFASSLMFEFMAGYMYEYDEPKGGRGENAALDQELLQQLLHPGALPALLDAQAIRDVEQRLQAEKDGYRARTATELAELLWRIGDLSEDEISSRVEGDYREMLQQLSETRRALQIVIPDVEQPRRWINSDDFTLYRAAFTTGDELDNWQQISVSNNGGKIRIPVSDFFSEPQLKQQLDRRTAQCRILERFLMHHTLTTVDDIRERYPLTTEFIEQQLQRLESENSLLKLPPGTDDAQPQFVFRETLERIRKVTLFLRRNRIEPCDTARFVEFLLSWQHRTAETQLSGIDGLFTVIEQLQGVPLHAALWENDVFARRVRDYHPSMLDDVCTGGAIIWHGFPASGGDWGQLAFAFRDDLSFLQPLFAAKIGEPASDENIEQITAALHKKGACFVSDLSQETGLTPSVITTTLWEMIWQGAVTNDTFTVIRAGKPATPSDSTQRDARRSYSRRMVRPIRRYRPLETAGRWVIPVSAEAQQPGIPEIEMLARQLLQRYGLLCREIYELEGWPVPWRTLYDVLIRLEWRGDIQRGYFVKGLSGLQFALPQAADALLTDHSQRNEQNSTGLILLNSCDPANLYGAASPLPVRHPLHADWRLLRHPNNYLILDHGVPIIAIEASGIRLTPLRDLTTEQLRAALKLLPHLLDDPAGWRRIRSLKVELWNNQPIRNSEIAPILKQIGFRDEYKVMILERWV